MTNFNYDPTIPNPPDDPADDVDQMQTNSASIDGIIAIDHVGFNVASGGTHKQVTFSSNNTPAGPAFTPPTLFTYLDAVSNLAQLKYYTGNAAHSSDQYNTLTTNGSTMLLGGIIIKWGSGVYVGGATSEAVVFTNAFPHNCFSVQVTSIAFRNGSSVQSIIKSGFTAQRGDGGGSGQGFNWIAIGN